MSPRLPCALFVFGLMALLLGCTEADPGETRGDAVLDTTVAAKGPVPLQVDPDEPLGDATRGRELATKFECQRCHESIALPTIASERHCVRCHQEILGGRFHDKPEYDQWAKNVSGHKDTPSLWAIGSRYRPSFVVSYLLAPHDLRPALLPTMPRLAMTRDEARDVTAFLFQGGKPAPAVSLEGANPEAGRRLMEAKECGACHVMTGVPALPGMAERAPGEVEKRTAVALAPDLRFVRDKYRPAELVSWIRDPGAIKADTYMPKVELSAEEARDIAAYLLTTPLDLPPPTPFVRLPLLERRVTFEEIDRRILGKTCRHCHGNPDVAKGDGGPGNSGGFGFAPKRLEMTSYATISAGYVDAAGERHSVFEKLSDGTPRIVAALLARHEESAGAPRREVRGMPLALPPLSAEDIQLMDSWVAQGRPR
jgi:cytochrome c2